MSRSIPLALSLFFVACSSSSSSGDFTDGGTDGTFDTQSDVASDACTDCLGAQLTWGSNGGLTAYDDSSAISPCNAYVHSRVHHNVDVGGTQSCTTVVAACGVTGVVGLTQIENALADADVVAALASAPVLFGRDTRPADGQVFQITYGGRTISVGLDCDETGPCTPVPAGIKAFETILQNLDIQELSKDSCVAVFP
jgi:hypothetical protein